MALKLTMTCGPYDRARSLIDGTVKPEGIDLQVHVNGDDQDRQARARAGEFDACEFYTGFFVANLPYKTLGFTAIPIFVKRMFRHSYLYVNTHAGIRSPSDLNGRRVGLQTWFTTMSIWGRAILEDEFGVDLKSIAWVVEYGRKVGAWLPPGWQPPAWLKLETNASGHRIRDLLSAGEIDAAMTTETWAPDVDPNIGFLLPNYAVLEREYYTRTGIFPIHHTLLIRDSVLDEHPWVAISLFDAWQESKRRCYEWLRWQRVHQTALWYRALWEEEQAVGGPDFYRWGFRDTRAEVDTLLGYIHRYGLTSRKLEPEELFHPSTLET